MVSCSYEILNSDNYIYKSYTDVSPKTPAS